MRRNRDFIGPAGMGGTVSLWGGSSLVESVQYGTVSVANAGSGTATITSVDTTRSVVMFLGTSTNVSSVNPVFTHAYAQLTNATTVTATCVNTAATRTISFAVIQFRPGVARTVQTYVITIGVSAGSGTATITSVNTPKALIVHGGDQMNAGEDLCATWQTLTNATTVTANNGIALYTSFIAGTVLEFF